MGDFYTGYCDSGHVRVAEAVAASSAFTPGFGALRLRIPEQCRFSRIDPWGQYRPASAKRRDYSGANGKAAALLTDGGVYDNLGIEPVWGKYSLLLSDAGSPFASVNSTSQFLVSRLRRTIEISLEQVGAIRKRWLVEEFVTGKQQGALWAINTLLEDFHLPDAQGLSPTARTLAKQVRTDLDAFTEGEIACLENHGYSLADAAIRSRAATLCPQVIAPFKWPHEAWCEDGKVCNALAESYRRHVLWDVAKYLARLGRAKTPRS